MTSKLVGIDLMIAIIGVCLFGCSLSAQQPSPTVLQNSNEIVFLTNAPCSAPCWQGLEIGISTESEVMTTVSTLNFIDQKTIRVIPQSVPDLNPSNWVQGKNIVATCINGWEPCLRLTIANDKLRDIDIELDYGLTLDMIINHFGNPDYIGSHHIGGDVIDCKIELIWLKQQLVLYSRVLNESEEVNVSCSAVAKNGILDANLLIKEVRYLPLKDLSIRIENNELTDYVGTK